MTLRRWADAFLQVVELIDREADMLNRGRSEASLGGLRKRLANLFLQFIETPEFNPEAARFQKVREALRPLHKTVPSHSHQSEITWYTGAARADAASQRHAYPDSMKPSRRAVAG